MFAAMRRASSASSGAPRSPTGFVLEMHIREHVALASRIAEIAQAGVPPGSGLL
jgi:hypothetical protein